MRGVVVCVLLVAGSLGAVSAAAAAGADPATVMVDHPLTNLIVGLTHDVLSGAVHVGGKDGAEVPVGSALSLCCSSARCAEISTAETERAGARALESPFFASSSAARVVAVCELLA